MYKSNYSETLISRVEQNKKIKIKYTTHGKTLYVKQHYGHKSQVINNRKRNVDLTYAMIHIVYITLYPHRNRRMSYHSPIYTN